MPGSETRAGQPQVATIHRQNTGEPGPTTHWTNYIGSEICNVKTRLSDDHVKHRQELDLQSTGISPELHGQWTILI